MLYSSMIFYNKNKSQYAYDQRKKKTNNKMIIKKKNIFHYIIQYGILFLKKNNYSFKK